MTTGRSRSNWKFALSRAAASSALCGLVAAPLLTSVAQAAPVLPPPAPPATQGLGRNDRDGRYDRGRGDYDNDDDRDKGDWDNGDDDTQVVTATVTRDLNGDSFQVREDGTNRTYTVDVVRGEEPNDLQPGDQVELRGDFVQGRFQARFVRLLDDDDNDNAADQVSLTGVVTRALNNDRFAIRADNGRTYQIQVDFDEPTRILLGDRVTVRGYFDDNAPNANQLFVAENIRLLGNNAPGNGYGQRAFIGTVTRTYADGHFTLRLRDGTILRVEPAATILLAPHDEGDSVRVDGVLRNNIIFANTLQVIGNGTTVPTRPLPGTPYPGNVDPNAQRVVWTERITSFTDATKARFLIRHNNATYTIEARNLRPQGLQVGDLVRVTALLPQNSRTLRALQVSLVDEDDAQPDQAVAFKATVNRVINDGSVEVRGDNGQLYVVSYRYARNFRQGDRIRVRGTYRTGTVFANGIDRL